MKLTLIRKIFTEESTISELYIDGKFFCDQLEDKDRGLTSDMTEEEILSIKIPGKTAIPTGVYTLIMDMSTRFSRIMPHILDVPGFQGIRIHSGNWAKDTDGCLISGSYNPNVPDQVLKSRVACDALYKILNQIQAKGEKITIEINENNQ